MSTPGGQGGPERPGGGWESSWQQQYPQDPYQQQPTQQQWGAPPPHQPSSGSAIAALVLGICGIVLCPIVPSILALVFGYKGRDEVDRSGGAIGGRGMATAGVVLGWVGLAIWALLVGLIIIGAAVGDEESTFESMRAASALA